MSSIFLSRELRSQVVGSAVALGPVGFVGAVASGAEGCGVGNVLDGFASPVLGQPVRLVLAVLNSAEA